MKGNRFSICRAVGVLFFMGSFSLLGCGSTNEKAPVGTTSADQFDIPNSPSSETTTDTNGDKGDVQDIPGVTTQLTDGSWICRPQGQGPFPAVLYNHGGLGDAIGGDLEGTCRALAEEGFLAHSAKRPETVSLEGHLDKVLDALDSLRENPDADKDRIGIMGFSRGGLLTLQAAIERPDNINAIVLFAPAPAKQTLENTLKFVAAIGAPVRVYVAANDLYQADHVQLAKDVEAALRAANKEVELTIYPEFGNDGHELFFELRDSYWLDVLAFLEVL
tara:strand:+ start:670 stop:1497 length:828 start_codon:yes stop_codon:yes gene_type:complete